MVEKKKPKSVEDLINEYQKFHHKAGKKFEERIKKFEEFHDPENIHAQQFAHHAHYVIFGKPSDLKEFPGAYNEAYKVLDKHVTEDNDKLEDEDKLTEILETYANTFLQKAMGNKFKDIMEHAEKEAKLDKKTLRELKGQLISRYLKDQRGNFINILHEQYIKGLKGKKKVDLIAELQNISQKMKETYTSLLHESALDGLVSEDDRLEMAKYITPHFEKKGWKPKGAHITRSAEEQLAHYATLLQGAGEELRKVGYKHFKHEEKKEKEKK